MEKYPIIIERVYEAAAEKVWNALTDPEKMKQWYFPMMPDFRTEAGFRTEFDVPSPNGKNYRHLWTVTQVIADRKIAYEWKYPGYPGNGLVSFEIIPNEGKTKLTLTFQVLESFEPDKNPELSLVNFTEGWTYFAGALKEFLEK